MLEKSRVYASLLKERMDRARANMEKKAAPAVQTPEPRRRGRPSKAAKREPEPDAQEEQALEKQKTSDTPEEADGELPPIEQPALISGTKLKGYQLEGLAWMASLYENGISVNLPLRMEAFNSMHADAEEGNFGGRNGIGQGEEEAPLTASLVFHSVHSFLLRRSKLSPSMHSTETDLISLSVGVYSSLPVGVVPDMSAQWLSAL
jgi:hypothetical protein